jgi:hypothetical protein
MSNKKSALDIFKQKSQDNDTTEAEHADTVTLQHDNVIQPGAQYKKRKVYKNVPWYPPTERLKKEVKKLALDEDTSMSNLITIALGLLFESKGKSIKDYM